MSISFKEFSNILEKGQAATGGTGKFKSTAPKGAKTVGGKSKEGKLGGGLSTKLSGFSGGFFGKKSKKDKDVKPKIDKKPKGKKGQSKPKVTKPPVEKKKKPGFFAKYFTQKPDPAEIEKEKKQKAKEKEKDTLDTHVSDKAAAARKTHALGIERGEQQRKAREGLAKKREKDRADKEKADRIAKNKSEIEKEKQSGKDSEKRKEKNKDKIEKEKRDAERNKTMNKESTIKEDWIEDKLIDKLLSRNRVKAAKIFNAMSKREKMKYLDTVQSITSRNHGYTDDEVVDALQDFNIDISKKARKVKGGKTLTKKTQEKITINPMEKQPSRGV